MLGVLTILCHTSRRAVQQPRCERVFGAAYISDPLDGRMSIFGTPPCACYERVTAAIEPRAVRLLTSDNLLRICSKRLLAANGHQSVGKDEEEDPFRLELDLGHLASQRFYSLLVL